MGVAIWNRINVVNLFLTATNSDAFWCLYVFTKPKVNFFFFVTANKRSNVLMVCFNRFSVTQVELSKTTLCLRVFRRLMSDQMFSFILFSVWPKYLFLLDKFYFLSFLRLLLCFMSCSFFVFVLFYCYYHVSITDIISSTFFTLLNCFVSYVMLIQCLLNFCCILRPVYNSNPFIATVSPQLWKKV